MLLVTSGGIAWHAFEVLQVYYFSLTRFVKTLIVFLFVM